MSIEVAFVEIGRLMLQPGAGFDKAAWGGFDWQVAARAYAATIYEQQGTLQILGVQAPMPLTQIYTPLYFLDELTPTARFELELAAPPASGELEQQPASAMVAAGGNYLILGKPGAGKTTLLKHLALELIGGYFGAKIPILLKLKAWANTGQEELLPFLAAQFAGCGFPNPELFLQSALQTGQVVLLLDGLDEVGAEGVLPVLEALSRTHEATQCLVTCRLGAEPIHSRHFTVVELADLNLEQMNDLIRRWFQGKSYKYEQFLREFAQAERHDLRLLGRTPLCLTLLCIAFERTMSFPCKPLDLYDHLLSSLLPNWNVIEATGRPARLSPGDKGQLLAEIACITFAGGDYLLPLERLAGLMELYLQDPTLKIDARATVRSLEVAPHLLVERAKGLYAFPHLTCHEYLAARYIVENAAIGTLDDLITYHLTDRRWRQVFLFVAGLLPRRVATRFFELLHRAIAGLLAGDEQLVALVTCARRKAEAVNTLYKPAAVRSFYLYLELDLNLAASDPECRQGNPLSHALALALSFVQEQNVALNFDYALLRLLQHARANALAPAPVRDCRQLHTLALTLAFSLDLTLDPTLLPGRFEDLVTDLAGVLLRLVVLSRQLGLINLHHALSGLLAPPPDAPPAIWQKFAAQLQQIIIEQRDMGRDRPLTENQIALLSVYLQANQLLLDCLELARVADKAAMEQSLLHSSF